MVSGLIEEQDVSPEKHRTSEGEFHLPTTGQTADSLLLALIVEPDGGESLDDLGLSGEDTLVSQYEREDRGIFFAAINVVLDIEGADVVG